MLWGAFNNACGGMMAMSWDMGTISQNVANINTTGYKRKETLFKTLMSESKPAPGNLKVFTVGTKDRTMISGQGVITPTDHWSDLAINGRGFFMVGKQGADGDAPTTTLDAGDPGSILYTRAGKFEQIAGANDRNYLVTSSGQYLLGWQADDTGVVDTGTLAPVFTTPTTSMTGVATTEVILRANINSDAAMTASNQLKTLDVTDPLGGTHTLSLAWTRTAADTWTVDASLPAAEGTATGSFTATINGLGTMTAPTVAQAVSIAWAAGYGGGTTTENISLSAYKPTQTVEKIVTTVNDSAFNEKEISLAFEKFGHNSWYLHYIPTDGTTTTASTTVTFDALGQIDTPDTTDVAVDWTAGTSSAVTLDISSMTQLFGGTTIDSIVQNGYATGSLRRADFNGKGELVGSFDNGRTRTLFQIPLANFVSENNLESISGTLFKRSTEAGELTISSVQDVPGYTTLVSNAAENSTADIGDEFTKMIITQKAYSSNATVFRTADEMVTTARDLKA